MEMKKKNEKRGVGCKKGDAVSCPQVPVGDLSQFLLSYSHSVFLLVKTLIILPSYLLNLSVPGEYYSRNSR